MTETSNWLAPNRLFGLSTISDRFDAAILDQWGVLHDGAKAPSGAIDAVSAMAIAGKRLVVLSNSARLGSDASSRLAALGYNPALFAGFVTSGETVRNALRNRTDPFFAALGRSVLLIARDGTLIEGLNYTVAQSPEMADFVLLGSNTAPEQLLESHHMPILGRALARGLPMICANPDRVGVTAFGLVEGPGVLAAYYQALGGAVRYIGKPYPEVYDSVRALLRDISPERILAVGDSLEHDIAGGKGAGCLTVLIEGGIHAEAIAEEAGLEPLCAHYGVTPDFIISRLDW